MYIEHAKSLFARCSSSYGRMWAISLRHLRQMPRDIGRLINVFYWPLLDIMLWGFTAQWVQKSYAYDAKFSLTVLTAMVCWQLVVRANLDVSTLLLEDIMDHNIANIFSTPLALFEWAGGIFMLSVINLFSLTLFCTLAVELFYRLNILQAGILLAPFIFNLFIMGLAIGFCSAGILISCGRRSLGIIYMMGWFFAPFSGAFYPITVLPISMQIIAQALPISRAIEGIRLVVSTGEISWNLFLVSLLMSSFYLICSFVFFIHMFARSKSKGLARLSD